MPAEAAGIRTLSVYSRPGCHLCEQLVEELLPLIRGSLDLEIIDIDRSPSLIATYGTRIPVVQLGDRVLCEFHLDRQAVLDVVAACDARRAS